MSNNGSDNNSAPASAAVERPRESGAERVQNNQHAANEIHSARSSQQLTTEHQAVSQFTERFNNTVDRNNGAVSTNKNGELTDPKSDHYLYRINDGGVPLSLSPGAVNDRGQAQSGAEQALASARPGGGAAVNDSSQSAPGSDAGQARRNQASDSGDKSKLSDAVRPGETPDQAAKREADELRSHASNPQESMDAQQQKLMNQSIDNIMNNKQADGSDRNPPLTPEQKAQVLHETNRLFNESDRVYGQGLTQQDRNLAATAMTYDTANPGKENQGQHNSCNATTIGKVETMQDAGANAKRFADMYTNANGDHTVTMPDGKKIQYDVNSLHADQEARTALTDQGMGQGGRDQFVAGMNHLYVNDATQRRQPPEFYTQERAGQFGQSDTGERLHVGGFNGATRGADGRVGGVPPESSPSMSGDDVSGVMERMSGGKAQMLASKSHFGMEDGKINDVHTGADVDRAWDANGGKPMIAAVDTKAAMFHADGVGGNGGGHVVVVDQRQQVGTDSNGQPVYQYHVANSWGDKYNGWVTSDQLASSMDPTKGDRSGAQYAYRGDGSNSGGKQLPPPGTSGEASGGYASNDTSHSGTRRSDNGIVPQTDNMPKDQKEDWYKRYQENLQKEKDDEYRRAELKKLMDAAAKDSQGGGG